uniref:Uncharacterized protein n=1 Tax=Anguilla anguilla TaxID=7936 RepID=A0A0E9TWG8_ANGAN
MGECVRKYKSTQWPLTFAREQILLVTTFIPADVATCVSQM